MKTKVKSKDLGHVEEVVGGGGELDSDGPEGSGFKPRVIDTARSPLIRIVRDSESPPRGQHSVLYF